MMKLYYSPGACSLASHIALREAGLAYELVLASTKTKKLLDGTDYLTINPKGGVPLLELANGERLSEGPVILQYIADQAPDKNLAPAPGSWARYRLQEWLNFITSEVHKSFTPLFNMAMPEAGKAISRTRLGQRFAWIDAQLEGRQYLLGDQFSVADAYLFNVSNWTSVTQVDISGLSHLLAYRARVAARPAVVAAMQAEGLIAS